MKAIAVTLSKKEIGIIDQFEPKILLLIDVKFRMIEVGVCGTDKEICTFEYSTPPNSSEQLVINHESLKEIVEVGPKVTRMKLGDIVVPIIRRPCPHDYYIACHSDRQDFCFTGDFRERDIKEQNSFITQY